MITQTGPFIYADDYVLSTTEGADDAQKFETVLKSLIYEIESVGSCLEDVIAVHKFFTPQFDNALTRDVYVKYFKSIMPSLTGITFSELGKKDAQCLVKIMAVKGCSTGEEWMGTKLERTNFASGSPLEAVLGYSRAVKAGPFVFVGGTTSVLPDKSVAGAGDSDAQDEFIWNKIISFVEKAGGSKNDVVKVKKYFMLQYNSSGKSMPSSKTQPSLTQEIPIASLTRPGQLEEVELAAVIGIGEEKVPPEWSSYFDEL